MPPKINWPITGNIYSKKSHTFLFICQSRLILCWKFKLLIALLYFFTILCGFKVIIGSSEHSSNPAQQLLHCVFVCVFHVDRGALAPLYSQSLTFFG